MFERLWIRWLLLGLGMPLAGCASLPSGVAHGDDEQYAVTAPPPPVAPEHNAGAIYQPAIAAALFQDFKARRQGDVLTVLLTEETNARQSSNTASSSDARVDIANPVLFGRPVTRDGVPVLRNQLEASRSFSGEGDSAQSNLLEGSITVTVAEVLPNGNLVVQGEKWMTINQSEEFIRLRGIVRPVDVRADNTVRSTQLADVQVAYGGRGHLAESNRPGWLARFFSGPLWPF